MEHEAFDVAVVGAGPVGLLAALRLGQSGHRVCLVGPEPARQDGRSAALFGPSVELLEQAGLWPALVTGAGPLRILRIVDDTGSLFRPPPVEFRADEIGLAAFGWNVGNADLTAALATALRDQVGVTWIETAAAGFEDGDPAGVLLADGTIVAASLVVAADGRRSVIRTSAGIGASERSYPQSAFTTVLSHERDHGDVSTEFHTRGGPFTLVPLPGRRSSLVWVTSPHHARRLAASEADILARAVEERSHALLGAVEVAGPRGVVPLVAMRAQRLAAGRLVLVGEAAHVLPPIGAQGLNLGFADVAALLRAVESVTGGLSTGDVERATGTYARARALDIGARTTLVDGLNRALLSDLLPVDLARGLGLGLLGTVGPLRRSVMRLGFPGRSDAVSSRTAAVGSRRS